MAMTPIEIDSPTGRICCHCKKKKPFSEFNKNNGIGGVAGLHRECKQCQHKHQKKWYQRNREKVCAKTREYHRKHRLNPGYKAKERGQHLRIAYGITLAEYDKMLEKQNGVCAICSRPEIAKNQYGIKRLSVDHNHETGQVRALLCNKCNRTLGAAGDDIELLKKLIKYLRKF